MNSRVMVCCRTARITIGMFLVSAAMLALVYGTALGHTGQGNATPSNAGQGHPWDSNVCTWSPDSVPGLLNFEHACDHHDGCYVGFAPRDGAATYWVSKDQCDLWFLKDMQASCREQHPDRPYFSNLTNCLDQAIVYFGAVQQFGGGYYKRPIDVIGRPRPDTHPPITPLPQPEFPVYPPIAPIGPGPVNPPPPPPTQHIFHVHNTCADRSCGLWVMTAPGSSFGGRQIGTLNDGDAANIRCQTVGGMISGGEGSNDVWDQINYAAGIGYVADLYMDTPGGDTPQPHRHFTPGISRC